MLALVLACSISTGGVRGQGSYTPVNYNFDRPPRQAPNQVFGPPGELSYPDFGISSEAANGYGQWCATDEGFWVLWGNDFNDYNVSNPAKPVPTGAISWGSLSITPNSTNDPNNLYSSPLAEDFGSEAVVKVVANLQGSVRFIWPNSVGTVGSKVSNAYIIEGFDDHLLDASFPPQLSLNFEGIPKPTTCTPLTCTGQTPTLFPPVNIGFAGAGFDVAIDAKFLYVLDGGQVLTYNLSDGSLVSSIDIDFSATTIACDIRNEPSGPTFDVCGPTATSLAARWCINGTLKPIHSLPITVELPCPGGNEKLDPNQTPPPVLEARILVGSVATADPTQPHPTPKCIYFYHQLPYPGIPTVSGESYDSAELMFLRITNESNGDDIQDNVFSTITYRGIGDNFLAEYLEGPQMTTHPLPISNGNFNYKVSNFGPIVAFANPYDAQNATLMNFDEFHCIYKMDIPIPAWLLTYDNGTDGNLMGINTALCIISGDRNGCWGSFSDSRWVLNTKLIGDGPSFTWLFPSPSTNSPGDFVIADADLAASVNQMGIHVRWFEGGSINGISPAIAPEPLYTKDGRVFDEPIEERTIVSNTGIITDGTSHGGTVGADLRDGAGLAIWTDMTTGVSTDGVGTNTGLYEPSAAQGLHYHNGYLYIDPSVTQWNVCPKSYTLGTYFVMLPNTLLQFGGTGNQVINFNGGSTWDFFEIQNPAAYIPSLYAYDPSLLGSGTLNFVDSIGNEFATVPLPTINIHGGAVLEIPESYTLNIGTVGINLLWESSVSPPYLPPSGPNIPTTGTLILHGLVNFFPDAGWNILGPTVTSNLPPGFSQKCVIVQECVTSGDCLASGEPAFSPKGVVFQNINDGAFPLLYYNFPQNPVNILSSTFLDWGVSVYDPSNTFAITSSTFSGDEMGQNLIYFNEDNSSGSPYSTISVNNCSIFNEHTGANGVYLNGFNTPSQFTDITIQDNIFNYDDISSLNSPGSAIEFYNTDGTIVGNQIGGSLCPTCTPPDMSYSCGINIQHGFNSFICNNDIKNINTSGHTGKGIYTFDWTGYAKLNEVSGCDIGHYVDAASSSYPNSDIASIDFSHYTGSFGPGLSLSPSYAIADLRGVHTGGNNYAAYDTIDNNNTQASSSMGEIFLSGNSVVYLGTDLSPSTTEGRNNIISSGHNLPLIYNDMTKHATLPLNGIDPNAVDFGINQNFFAFDGGATPITLSGTTGPLSPGFPNVTWNNPGTNIDLIKDAHINADPPYTVSCGNGFGEIISLSGHQKPLSVQDTSIDPCQASLYYAQQNYASIVTAPSVVDTMEHYVETCAKVDSNYIEGIGLLWSAAGWSGGPGFWQTLRTWLESVMGRDKSQTWLCTMLGDIQNTYENQDPSDYNDAVAVLDYEICCSPCTTHDSAYESSFWQDRAGLRIQEDIVFQDTVRDSLLTPIDTSEPTMHDLGLDSLVQYFGELGVQNASAENIITNPSAYPNPTGDGTVISFGTTKGAYVIIALYNVLGQQAASQGFQNMMQPGNHEVPISLQGLPSGTYYARIQTSFGIQTVKLVKE